MNSEEVKLIENVERPQENMIDVGQYFCTNMRFPDKEKLVSWVRNTAKKLGFVIIILRADNITTRTKPRVILGCDRSGSASDGKKGYVKQNIRKSSSKRCGCKFALKGYREDNNEWVIVVKHGIHNH